MEKQTGSKLGKEYIKAVQCHSDYFYAEYISMQSTSMQSTSWEIHDWIKQKLE